MASYPSGVVNTFTTHVNLTEIVDASHPNLIQAEVVAIETTLGVNPHIGTIASSSGTFNNSGTTFASVSARLANIETGVVADSHTHYVHKSGGDTIAPGAGVVGLIIQPTGTPSTNVFTVKNSSGTQQIAIDSGYNLLVGGSSPVVSQANAATTVTTQAVADAGAVGVSTNYARQDHKHVLPATYTPSAHSHVEADVTSLTSDLAGKLSTGGGTISGALTVTGILNAGTLQQGGVAPSFPGHTHVNGDLTQLSSATVATASNANALGGVGPSGYATSSHGHNPLTLTAGYVQSQTLTDANESTMQYNVGTGSMLRCGNGVIRCVNGASSGYVPIYASAFTVQSDEATKTDIKNVPFSALGVVLDNPAKVYRYRKSVHESADLIGPMANGLPEGLVHQDKDSGVVAVNVMNLIGLLWSAVEELSAKVDTLPKSK